MADLAPLPCPFCGSRRGIVHVHSHGQCASCGTNLEPCCAGDNANDAATSAHGAAAHCDPVPQLFPELFQSLGGEHATVTGGALLFALSTRLGSDYDEARLVLEAAGRVGIVMAPAPDMYRLCAVDRARQGH